jgi:hypothetical protein
MKTKPVLLAATALALAALSATAQENVFPEGGFEIMGAKGKPEGWVFPDPTYMASKGGAISLEGENGGTFLRIVSAGEGDAPKPHAKLDLPENAIHVRLQYKLRSANMKVLPEPAWAGGFMGGSFIDADGQALKPFVPSRRMKENNAEWIECEDTYPVPGGAVKVMLQPGLYFSTGTLDVDDVQVFIE